MHSVISVPGYDAEDQTNPAADKRNMAQTSIGGPNANMQHA